MESDPPPQKNGVLWTCLWAYGPGKDFFGGESLTEAFFFPPGGGVGHSSQNSQQKSVDFSQTPKRPSGAFPAIFGQPWLTPPPQEEGLEPITNQSPPQKKTSQSPHPLRGVDWTQLKQWCGPESKKIPVSQEKPWAQPIPCTKPSA